MSSVENGEKPVPNNSNENKISEKAREIYDQLREKKPKRNGAFLGEEQDKFYVAKSEEEIYELSALAYYVWLLCDGEHTVEEIANKISEDVQVSVKEVIEPLALAINSLNEAGLVEIAK